MSTPASTTNLVFRHMFGINSHVKDNMSYTDDDTIVYVAGHSVIMYNTVERRQRFLQSAEITEQVTAYSSGSGKRLAVVAERGDPPSFHVFDLRTFRRKKSIVCTDLLCKELVSLELSSDNQLVLTLGGAPDWTLMCWNWAKAKLIASCSVALPGSSVCTCMLSPLDPSVATVIGKEYVKFYRIGEKEMRPLHENHIPDKNFTACCWMRTPDDHLLAGTDDGQVSLFRFGEHLFDLDCTIGSENPITAMVSSPTGFVCGSMESTIMVFFYDDSKDQVFFKSQFTLAAVVSGAELSAGYVSAFSICPKAENLCFVTSDSQILKVSLAKPAALVADDVQYMVAPFHGPKPITGMDVALKKPLIITCGKDLTLRIWNIKTHKMELLKMYPEEMFSVAIHPNGLHCAVGFADKLRVYHILVDDIRLCMEVPIKGCRECRFSRGGHLLAAANGNSINVYDVHTGEKTADLRGHNSKVRSIYWMPSGFQLVSCGQDGAVYVWTIDGAKRTGEFVQKGTVYTSAVSTGTNVIAVGNDRSLRELSLPDCMPSKLHDAGCVLTNIATSTSKSVLFASTFEHAKPAYVRAYQYPITGDYDDYPCMSGHITRLCLTGDENFLVAADDLGCLLIMELKGRQDRFQRGNPASLPDLVSVHDWSDEVLVTRAELEDYSATVSELQTKVEELKLNNEYQLKLKDMNYAEKIKETTDKFVQELELAKSKYELLKEIRSDCEIESLERMRYMDEAHQSNIQNLETGFQSQIMDMVDVYQQLVRDRDAQIERLDEQRRHIVQSHEKYVSELTTDFEVKLAEDKHDRKLHEEEKTELEKELVETQNQLEDDIDMEIENMERQYEDKLAVARETTLKYKGENGIMKKKYVLMQRDIEDQKEEMTTLKAKEKELLEQIKMLEKEVSVHKKEIKARDLSVGEKERRIYELKKKNQELDKFKFVLDFKIRELKQQIEPRQMEILAMRDKIKNMDLELEQYHKSNAALDALIGDLRSKIDDFQAEIKSQRNSAKEQENSVSTFRKDLNAAIAHVLTPSLLYSSVKALVERYGSEDNIRPRIDPEIQHEYTRHKEYLQKSVKELKNTLMINEEASLAQSNELRQKNMRLIAEINTQRESNKALKMNIQSEIARVRQVAQLQSNHTRKKQQSALASLGSKASTAMSDEREKYAAIEGPAITSDFVEPSDMLDKNRKRILALRAAINELNNRSKETMATLKLPEIDNNAKSSSGSVSDGSRKSIPGVALPPMYNADQSLPSSDVELTGAEESMGIDTDFDDESKPAPSVPTYATEYNSPRATET